MKLLFKFVCIFSLACLLFQTETDALAELCKQRLTPGPCLDFYRRWAFSGDTCRQFIYGGCGGNDNNFGSEEECAEVCFINKDNVLG